MRAVPTPTTIIATTAMALMLALAPTMAQARDDGYAAMLAYLAASNLDGHALHGVTGVLGVNLATGDANQQANVRGFAAGARAAVSAKAGQSRAGQSATAPASATARIGGHALGGASGLISINQASGTANLELNTAGVVVAQQGTHGASADRWLADVCACTREATPTAAGQPASGSRRQAALVEASALEGTQGVVQLNQVAGSGNVTANQLALDVGVAQR